MHAQTRIHKSMHTYARKRNAPWCWRQACRSSQCVFLAPLSAPTTCMRSHARVLEMYAAWTYTCRHVPVSMHPFSRHVHLVHTHEYAIRIYTCIYIHMYLHVCAYLHVCVYVQTFVRIYVYICIYRYIYITYMYIYNIYIYIYINKYIYI